MTPLHAFELASGAFIAGVVCARLFWAKAIAFGYRELDRMEKALHIP